MEELNYHRENIDDRQENTIPLPFVFKMRCTRLIYRCFRGGNSICSPWPLSRFVTKLFISRPNTWSRVRGRLISLKLNKHVMNLKVGGGTGIGVNISEQKSGTERTKKVGVMFLPPGAQLVHRLDATRILLELR